MANVEREVYCLAARDAEAKDLIDEVRKIARELAQAENLVHSGNSFSVEVNMDYRRKLEDRYDIVKAELLKRLS